MARLFNVEVFSKTINGGGSPPYARYTSGEQFYALLGSADTIILQVILEATEVAATTVTVEWQTTNATEENTWQGPGVSGAAFAATTADQPKVVFIQVPTDKIGSNGRVSVSSDQPGATVRVIACGRSNG